MSASISMLIIVPPFISAVLLTLQDYIIPNNRHATLFYHDHSVGITSENVYAGECSASHLERVNAVGWLLGQRQSANMICNCCECSQLKCQAWCFT